MPRRGSAKSFADFRVWPKGHVVEQSIDGKWLNILKYFGRNKNAMERDRSMYHIYVKHSESERVYKESLPKEEYQKIQMGQPYKFKYLIGALGVEFDLHEKEDRVNELELKK